MRPILLLLLPTLATCHITITIETGNSSSTSSVRIKGNEANIISDNEQTTFGVTDTVLKNAIEKYSGGRPQDVFLHSPTPWNDLYQTYGWREVQRVFKPTKGTILDVQSETVVISLKELDNNSTSSAEFNASLTGQVEDSIQHKWHKAGVFDIKDPIFYAVNGLAFFANSAAWGMDSKQTKIIKIGENSNVVVFLKPGDMVSAALTATKVTMTVQIDYTANLSGHVACNYPKRYNGHHFWRYEINSLMVSGSMIRYVSSSEVISLQFYIDANIIVTDKATNARISEVPARMSSEFDSDLL